MPLSVSRASKIFEILERTAGKDLAFAAAENPTTRSVHIIAGNGGLAWFQLLWPHNDIAAANNPTFAWHRPVESTLVAGHRQAADASAPTRRSQTSRPRAR